MAPFTASASIPPPAPAAVFKDRVKDDRVMFFQVGFLFLCLCFPVALYILYFRVAALTNSFDYTTNVGPCDWVGGGSIDQGLMTATWRCAHGEEFTTKDVEFKIEWKHVSFRLYCNTEKLCLFSPRKTGQSLLAGWLVFNIVLMVVWVDFLYFKTDDCFRAVENWFHPPKQD
jgi:hypothetical protein